MSTKKKKQKNKMPNMLRKLLESFWILDPNIQAEIANAQETGDYSTIIDICINQAEFLTADISRMHFEEQLAQANPLYPQPATENFMGNILVGYIVDPTGYMLPQEFNASLESLNCHWFECGSPGTGKTRGIISLGKNILLAHPDAVIWLFDPKQSLRHFFHPKFVTLSLSDFRGQGLRPPTKRYPDYKYRNLYINTFGSGQFVKTASKYKLLQVIKKSIRRYGKPYPTNQMILATLEKEKKLAKSFRESDPIESLINRYSGLVEDENHTDPYYIPIEVLMNTNLIIECGDQISEVQDYRIYELLNSLLIYKKFERDKKLPFNLIVFDEGRTIFTEQSFNEGDSVLESMFAMAREFGIGFIVSTQEPSSISKVLKANVRTKIAFPLSEGRERQDIALSMGFNHEQYKFYEKLLSFGNGYAIANYGDIDRPFLIKIPHVADPLYIPDSEINELKSEFLKPFKIVEPTPPSVKSEQVQLPKDHMIMLNVLVENPYLNSSELYDFCNLPPELGTEIRFYLRRDGYLALHDIQINKGGRTPVFSELTDKSFRLLKAKSNYYGGEGFKHALGKHVIDVRLTKRSWIVELEAPIKGRPGQRYDVLAEKDGTYHAFEVTIHLKNLKENIAAALCDDRINTLFIVTLDKATKNRCIKNSGTDDPRVKFITISEVDKKEKRKEANK